MTAIFKSTQQALHFSYMLLSQPSRDGGQLGRMLERMELDATGIRKSREMSTVNFAGLTELDIRAQCSMVTARVQSALPSPEAWAIRSKYGCTEVRRDKSGQIIAASFGKDRADAMLYISEYLQPSFESVPVGAMPYLVARICGENDLVRPTFRAIESAFGLNISTATRAEKRVKVRIRELCNMGCDKLTPDFVRDGLVQKDGEN
jgi:hypothetical protein